MVIIQRMDEQQEIWKPIAGYEGRYEVSNLGRVRSFHRRGCRILRLSDRGAPDNYLIVSLALNGRTRTRLVHHLVLLTFVGPRPEGMVACHTNDVPHDNRLENLRWDTQEENMADRLTRDGKRKRLTPEMVREIRSLQFSTKAAGAAHYGIAPSTFHNIRTGKTWTHVS